MYFYITKLNGHENKQAQLLEMHRHSGFRYGNGKSIDGVSTQPYSDSESCGGSPCNFFIL